MKEKSIRIRLSQRRYDKLRLYAETKEKTVTQLVEDWIDRLSIPRIDDSDARGLANAPLSSIPLPNQPDG
ncbi:hypothetical protein NIES22_38640 [Calothrix brevissima NIES-22]|nr:hypothetical protein NIES22_38640 [Calothrix brevissima NIES-22]